MRADRVTAALSHLGRLDELASASTPAGRIDPRAKLVTTAAFLLTVASFGRFEVSALLPLLAYPIALLALGDVPLRPILWRMALVAPFAVLVGALDPILDRRPLVSLGPVALTAGWVAFGSILLRFALSVSAALLLVATTGLDAVAAALAWFRIPQVLVVQLLFLYRYLFVLSEEVARVLRAHALRSPSRPRPRIGVAGTLLGQVLLRTLDRAQRIHTAMLCRGFDGDVRFRRPLQASPVDATFVLGWCAFFLASRAWDLPRLLGIALTGIAR
ncbi:MAG TPA: cobalt ECF transporter T component CbiQ [Anaeromyxobacteraceae bacterium]|nr:cobalt ECF transporter T component CbiQ [Anaeromyxobacteraceae bacterium]